MATIFLPDLPIEFWPPVPIWIVCICATTNDIATPYTHAYRVSNSWGEENTSFLVALSSTTGGLRCKPNASRDNRLTFIFRLWSSVRLLWSTTAVWGPTYYYFLLFGDQQERADKTLSKDQSMETPSLEQPEKAHSVKSPCGREAVRFRKRQKTVSGLGCIDWLVRTANPSNSNKDATPCIRNSSNFGLT